MQIKISDDYESLSSEVADDLFQCLDHLASPLVCVASGDTPAGLYRELVSRQKAKKVDTSHWNFVGLDEWGEMNGSVEGSCRFYLDRQLFQPLGVSEKRICFFDGMKEAKSECERVESFIREKGGIEVAILGLGMNGHVGMNEPGSAAHLRSHQAMLDPVTQKVGQKYFNNPVQLSYGLTLGMGTLLDAKNIFLLVNGSRKAQIVQKLVQSEISPDIPGTLLRHHKAARLYLDREAAILLNFN